MSVTDSSARQDVEDFLDAARADADMKDFYVGCALGRVLKVGRETPLGLELFGMIRKSHEVTERIFLPPVLAQAKKRRRLR